MSCRNAKPPVIRVYRNLSEKDVAEYEYETTLSRVRQFFRQFSDSREAVFAEMVSRGITWERRERQGSDMSNAQRALTAFIIDGGEFSYEGVKLCKYPWREQETA